jgi:hypothetical protein
MKTGPDALNTVENDRVWERKILKLDPNALSIVENKSGGAKHENKTQRPRYRIKRVEERKIRKRYPTPLVPSKTSSGVQNMLMGPDVLGSVENDFGSARHENGTWCPQFRRKGVRECKT